jgi:hypothetical protein
MTARRWRVRSSGRPPPRVTSRMSRLPLSATQNLWPVAPLARHPSRGRPCPALVPSRDFRTWAWCPSQAVSSNDGRRQGESSAAIVAPKGANPSLPYQYSPSVYIARPLTRRRTTGSLAERAAYWGLAMADFAASPIQHSQVLSCAHSKEGPSERLAELRSIISSSPRAGRPIGRHRQCRVAGRHPNYGSNAFRETSGCDPNKVRAHPISGSPDRDERSTRGLPE